MIDSVTYPLAHWSTSDRAGTALKLLLYDGQGYWLCLKRLSQGRFTWWPTTADVRVPLAARELLIVSNYPKI